MRRPHMNVINASFELVGALLAWHSVALACAAPPSGVSPFMIAFSALWAVECIPYYRSHGDRLSTVGAAARCLAHALWCLLALRWYL